MGRPYAENNDAGGSADQHNDDDYAPLMPDADPDREEWEDRRYSGSLIEDAAAVQALGESLKAKMAEPIGENIFQKAARLNREEAEQRGQSDE